MSEYFLQPTALTALGVRTIRAWHEVNQAAPTKPGRLPGHCAIFKACTATGAWVKVCSLGFDDVFLGTHAEVPE